MAVLHNLSSSRLLKSLPYDAEVEYLESTGTQYIDTLYNANNATEFRMKYSGFTDKYFACGGREDFTLPGFTFSNGGTTFSSYSQYFMYYNRGFATSPCPNDDNIHEVQMSNVVIVDGVVIYTFRAGSFFNSRTFNLFRTNNEQRFIRYGYMRIYSCSLIDNGKLVRDYIPVRVGNVGYMYDKVSGQLFGNRRSTGLPFLVGPDV